jgi:HAD superfamily hydrolase (TIGR01484 family)
MMTMNLPYKLLALDLDGTTLMDDGKKVSPETASWVRKAISAGVLVVIATGRGMSRTRHLWEELCPESPIVLLNGAEIWERSGKLARRYFIEKEIIMKMHRLAKETGAGFWGYDTDGMIRQADWVDEMYELQWMKFGIKHDNPDTAAQLCGELLGWGALEVMFAHGKSLEITAIGATKLSGIQTVCEMHGIGMEEVMAIGDAANDLPLLGAVGLPVAMGNAEEAIKQIARGITDTNEHDGVAKAIQRFIFEQDV